MTDSIIPKLYDAQSIDSLEWPQTQEVEYVKPFLQTLVKEGIQGYIDNIVGEILILKIEDLVFPVIVPKENIPENSYVCSPYQHYITFGKQNVHLIPNPFVVLAVQFLMEIIGKIAKFGNLDSVVYVNNWLFSTDLYPEKLTEEHIQAISDLLKKEFPDRAILFRSLNATTNFNLMHAFEKAGFNLIASRMVYISNVKNEAIFQTRIFKSDLKLWKNTHYTIVDQSNLSVDDCDEFFRLQQLLYVFQHSPLQPQMNERYMKLLFQQKWLHFKALKLNGIIKGFVGYFFRNGVMYCPLIGFDKQEPDHTIIYRLLNTALLLEAKNKALFFNQSAGASFYKSVRRAQGTIEYTAILTKHLPFKQKMTWSILRRCMNHLGIKYMKKF